MDKKRKKFIAVGQCLVLAGFLIIALASTSAKDTINSKEFREGLKRGWEIGSSLSDANPDTESLEIDSISNNQLNVAFNY